MKIASLTFLFALCLSTVVKAQSTDFKDYKVVYSQGFNKDKSTDDFEFSDASKWLISKNGKPGRSLKCLGAGDYTSAHAGPSIVAVLKNIELKDFVIEMDVVQNGKDFNLLDFCIFFDIVDTSQYCYAQIAGKADKDSHNVFMVNNDKPKRLGKVNGDGVIWRIKDWHQLRIERSTFTKTIKVYFDEELVLDVPDESNNKGLIGFGSTNSAIKIDNLKVSAPAYETISKTIF
ncbi:hypothetical protein [Carboxylicivirga taeanensis]|uniref:hypothetical protein n=1 Tax=Carboxylicivirga taeanensis TaxID=1416875 RepID=UPI003F6DEA93